MGINNDLAPCDPDKVIHNYSSLVIPDRIRFLLAFGLDFCLPVYKLDFFKYFSSYENLADRLKRLNESANFESVCSGIKDIANKYYHGFKSYKVFSSIFSHKDLDDLKNFSKNRDIIVCKPDKGRGIVILDRFPYINKMLELVSNKDNFQLIKENIKDFTRRSEDKINRFLSKLKNLGIITEEKYKSLYVTGSGPGILYGLPKIHKPDFCSKFQFRPIFAAYNTPSFKIAKYLVPLLSPLTKNEYTVDNSTQFADEITNIPDADQYFMASFDIESLFSNIPLNETIDICIRTLFSNSETFMNFTKSLFKELLSLAVKSTFFAFNGLYYEQSEGLGMGLPLGPTFSNIFMCYHETEWLKDCPTEFKPILYRRYVDDTFLLFKDRSHVNLFYDYLNSKHKNIKFTYETEKDKSLSFLDINIQREGSEFKTSVYRKPTFTGLGSSYFSFCPTQFKLTAISTLITRAYRICSDYKSLHCEFTFLRNFFKDNGYPSSLVDNCINRFLSKIYSDNVNNDNESDERKENFYISLPYFGHQSEKMKSELRKFLSRMYANINFKIILVNRNRIGSYFNYKDKLSTSLKSSVVYKFNCCCAPAGASVSYIGSTKRHLYERVAEHAGLSSRTGLPVSCPPFSSIREHASKCNKCKINIDNFKIIGSCKSETELRILESLHIQKSRPNLNNMANSYPLCII